jgi:hypothetical protein
VVGVVVVEVVVGLLVVVKMAVAIRTISKR